MVFNRLWKRFMAALLLAVSVPVAYFGLQEYQAAKDSLAEEALKKIFLNTIIRSKDLESSFINAHTDIKNLRYGYSVTSLMEAVRDKPEDTVFWTGLAEKEFIRFLKYKEAYSGIGLLDPFGEEVAVVYRAGKRIAALENFRKRNHVTSAHFAEAARQEGAAVAAITMAAMVPRDVDLTQVTLIRYVTKVFDAKVNATGVMYLDLNGYEVQKALATISLENRRQASLVTGEGKYIFNSFARETPAYSTLSALERENIGIRYPATVTRQILSGRTGIITDDPEAFFAYAPVFPDRSDHSRFFVVYDMYPKALLEPAIGQVYRKYAMGAAGALALAALLAVALARALTRHLSALQEGVESFAQKRGESGRISIRSGDEIEALAGAFNAMADSLTDYSQSLEKKVAERTEQIKEVERKLMQAEKLAAIGFLGAGVAHEINNPISVVVTRLELIRRSLQKGEIDKAVKDLEVVSRHAQRIGRIAGNLLAFSRPKSGGLGPVSLPAAVKSVVELIEYPVTKKGIRIHLELDEAQPLAWGTASGMEQVIYNIVFNAYQALSEGGVITISTGMGQRDTVELSVADNGPGIPEETLNRIFEPFFTTKEVGQGSGLGLSISYGLVRDSGGEIEVRSLPGEGTVFTIRLKAAAAMERAAAQAAEEK